MPSERSQLRLLQTAVLLAAICAAFSPHLVAQSVCLPLHAALQCLAGSEAFHHLHVFVIRFLGELP